MKEYKHYIIVVDFHYEDFIRACEELHDENDEEVKHEQLSRKLAGKELLYTMSEVEKDVQHFTDHAEEYEYTEMQIYRILSDVHPTLIQKSKRKKIKQLLNRGKKLASFNK